MSEQLQITLTPKPSESPDAAWLENLLRGAHCWMSARDILATARGVTLHDRLIRELANSSPDIISGQKGYKHIEHATAEEVHHAAAWLESQARRMGERAGRIRRRAHQIFG